MRIFTYLSTVCLLVLQWSVIYAQQSLEEVKKQAYGNPFNEANEAFLNLVNDMESANPFSLLLFDTWQPMEIFGKDNERVTVDSANYHILDNRILFVNSGAYFELYPERIDHVVLGDRTFEYGQYKVRKNSLGTSYFEVLEDGDFTLLCRHAIEREVKNDHPMGLPAAREVKMRHDATLYYKTSDTANPLELPSKKRDLIRIFRRNRAEMAIFAAENNVSLKDQEEVCALFVYYNNLADDH